MADYLLTGVDDKLWRRFKASCDLRGMTMREFFIDCIKTSIKISREIHDYHKAEDHKPKKGGKKT